MTAGHAIVRPAEVSDFDAWFDLMAAVAAEGTWIGTELPVDREARRARFLEWLRRHDAASFLAVLDGRLVGTLGITLQAGMLSGVAELGMLVAADCRGRGVGSALMAAGLDWARSAGAHKVTLTVFPHNHAALALYAKFGFRTEGTLRHHMRRANGELWDAVTMGLVLHDPPALLALPSRGIRLAGLVLRPWEPGDAPCLVTALDDAEIHRFLDQLPDPYTLDDAHAFIARARCDYSDGSGAALAITRNGTIVGGIGLTLSRRMPRRGEVGYWVAASARSQGVATAALGGVVEWALTGLGLHRVQLHAAVANVASQRVAERAGFTREGVSRSWRPLHGRPADYALYARVRSSTG